MATAGEFALIDGFLRPFGLARGAFAKRSVGPRRGRRDAATGVLRGPGDDCAQLQPAAGQVLCATTDACVEGVHFTFATSTPAQTGHKALAMNLSDLAAAGARPRWFLAALGVPGRASAAVKARAEASALAQGIAQGMARLAKAHGIALVGGNVTRAAQWSITITALGEAERPLSRAGGQPGDLLVLCGALGEAALGLKLLQSEPHCTEALHELGAVGRGYAQRALAAQRTPAPLVACGLAAAPFASAAIDLSDGLLADLEHLCARSGCGAVLDLEQLPITAGVAAAETALTGAGAPAHSLSLTGGEDYALLCAVPPARHAALLATLHAAGADAHTIGALTTRRQRTSGQPVSLRHHGRALPLPKRLGHDHLA